MAAHVHARPWAGVAVLRDWQLQTRGRQIEPRALTEQHDRLSEGRELSGRDISAPESKNIPHVPALDELRGIAALMVLFAHLTHNLTRGVDPSIGAWLYPSNPFFAVLAEGHAGVSLFLVLSGFLFSYGAHNRQVSYRGFIRNRILRIFPMYVLLLFLEAYTYPAQFSFSAFASSLFLMGNTPAGLAGGAFTILLWTICVEFQFYLVFPFLNSFKLKYGVKYLVHLLGLAILLRILCVGLGASPRNLSYFTIVGRIDQFLIGMIAAHLYREGVLATRKSGVLLVGVSCLIVLSLFAFNRLGGWERDANWKALWHTYEGFLFASLIVIYVQAHGSFHDYYTTLLRKIGLVSYSLYLIHMPILLMFQKHNWYLTLTGSPYVNALLSGVYLVPVAVLVATATYWLIERPFIDLRGEYLKPVSAPARSAKVE
ncbi:acyltransferase [Bradyrhizobium sp. SZCCHNRI3042]|uniref:acyltransferase family protein n=1 Tax=Bradyrhizobium sp. SZCCHNRI3042 TaxID=3057291 RepID=UPI0029160EBF|nr:acyltransferase [Bradyrhizobium sp. SZCCHNRI3042]